MYAFTPEAKLHCCGKVNVDATFAWGQLIKPIKGASTHLIKEDAVANAIMIY